EGETTQEPYLNGFSSSLPMDIQFAALKKIPCFPDKPQHQLFLEPEGETTQEPYLNGFSSSLPMDIQFAA
ncbi:FAD-dependent oxidoreductase, partial [Vibrio parahaemolyticus]|nr:FAD-dependent oxidoreductase [Vibrio parahaemolyticus]